MLKALDDRVVEVTAMSAASPSYSRPEISSPDFQVALMETMKTGKDAILRMMCSFTQPTPPGRQNHWYQIIGTRGCLGLERSGRDRPKMWLAEARMHDMAEVDWRRQRTDAPTEAFGIGHGGNDYYVHTAFRDAVSGVNPLEMDVYDAVETVAPAILAVDSIGKGSVPLVMPDFQPNQARAGAQTLIPDKERDGAMR